MHLAVYILSHWDHKLVIDTREGCGPPTTTEQWRNKMRIINIFSGFQNAYNNAGWQLWDRSNLIGVYHTRQAARLARDAIANAESRI